MFTSLKRILLLLALALSFVCAHAADDDLLPVEQAFKLDAKAIDAHQIKLHWQIADGYYLYRDRIKVKTSDANLTLGALELSPATKKHDEFLGNVEVYHGTADGTQAVTVAAGAMSMELKVSVQGCHEVEPKICYPPFAQTLKLALPASSPPASMAAATPSIPQSSAAANNPLAKMLTGNDAPAVSEDGRPLPLPPEQAFVFEAIANTPTEILVRWSMPPGYYLYRDKSSVHLSQPSTSVALGDLLWPPGVSHVDNTFGNTTVYFSQVDVSLPVRRSAGAAQKLAITGEFQGCQENGICYPVMQREVIVDLPAAMAAQMATTGGVNTSTASITLDSSGQADDQKLAAQLGTHSLSALGWFFVFGLLLAFTPCVFPMLPILSGIIAGAGDNISTQRAFMLSLVYVLASSVVFTIAGVVAGLAGKNLQAAFQNPWVLASFAALFVLLSLSMFGFYELQLPSRWQSKIADVSNRQRSGSLAGVAVMGVLSALIVGPCVAPPLAAAVLYISQSHDPVFGGLALFALSLGMGAPLLLFGSAAGKLLPRAGAWMDAVKAVFGVVFLALAIWMLSRILDPLWIMALSGMLWVASAIYLGALERIADGASGWKKLWKALGIVLLIAGTVELLGVAVGGHDLLHPLRGVSDVGGANTATASESLPFRTIKSSADLDHEIAAAHAAGKTLMLDFYADWCVSCKEMEANTYSTAEVHRSLADFVLLKADVTANDDTDQALMKRFGIIGPPGTLFFNKEGVEQRGLRLTGQEDSVSFVARVAKLTR